MILNKVGTLPGVCLPGSIGEPATLSFLVHATVDPSICLPICLSNISLSLSLICTHKRTHSVSFVSVSIYEDGASFLGRNIMKGIYTHNTKIKGKLKLMLEM